MEQTAKTAHHEASHFIAYLLYIASEDGYMDFELIKGPNGFERKEKRMLVNLSIVPKEDSWGRLHPTKDVFLAWPESIVKMIIAGPASDFILSGEADPFSFLGNRLEEQGDWEGSDSDTLIDLTFGYLSDDSTVTDFLHPHFIEVINDLKAHWETVQFVANELIQKEHIEGTELDELAYLTAGKMGIEI